MFPRNVFAAGRNNLAIIRLADVSAIEHLGVPAMNGLRRRVPAIDGIIEEANETAGEVADKTVLDAALVNAAQTAERL